MKVLKNYWFLQDPIDVEHKFYVLMDFLQSVEQDLSQKKYNEQIQKIRRIHDDLKTFRDKKNLSDRTLVTMTQTDLEQLKTIQEKVSDNKQEELKDLIDNSLGILDNFLTKINPLLKEINDSISIKAYEKEQTFKDQGYLVLRIPGKRKFKIYSWMFSFVKVKQKDQIGILITELLDPLPKYSISDKKIMTFFEKEIKIYNPALDSFIFADLDKSKSETEIGFDLMKERGIQFIVESYQKFLSA